MQHDSCGSKKADDWNGVDGCYRVLVGMQKLPQDELRENLSLLNGRFSIDNQAALRLKKQLTEEFRQKLTLGAPANEDEQTLRRLAAHLRAGKGDRGLETPVLCPKNLVRMWEDYRDEYRLRARVLSLS